MKKILFLLLCTVSIYGQTYPNPIYGTVTEKTNTTDSTPAYFTTSQTDGVHKKTPAALIATTAALDSKKNATSTAITSLATLTNNGTTFSLSALQGVIVDNSTVPAGRTVVNFAGATNVTPLYFRTILYINSAGTLVQFNGATMDLTAQQRVENLFIGIVIYSGGSVQVVQLIPDIEYSIDNRFSALGNKIRNINDGNNLGPNGANLQINKGAGTTWRLGSNFVSDRKVPDETTDIAATPVPASPNLIGYRNGSGGWTYEAYTGSLTPQFWDNGTGTKATVANNKFTNQRVYFFNGTNTYVIYLGRTEHATLLAATTEAEKPNAIVDPATSVGSLIGTVSVEKSCTDLTSITLAAFTQGPRMQGGSSSGGASGSQSLQNTYLNSVSPQIVTTPSLGSVDFQNGTASDTNPVTRIKNIAGTVTHSVAGNGNITGGTYNGYVPESITNKATDFSVINNTLYPSTQAVNNRWGNVQNLRYASDFATNLFAGTGAGISNTPLSSTQGEQNTAIGVNAANSNTTGYANLDVGYNAGFLRTTGGGVTNIGYQAGYNGVSNGFNVNVGTDAGARSKSNLNTYVGWHSGFGFTTFSTGDYVNLFGAETGLSLLTATRINGFGYRTFYNLTDGYSNCAFGDLSSFSMTTGFNNNAYGRDSLFTLTTGNGNNVFGQRAGYSLTGSGNSLIGDISGFALTNASDNVHIGSGSGSSGSQKVDAINTIAIGSGTFTTANNQAVFGNSSITETILRGNLSIGYSGTPTAKVTIKASMANSSGGVKMYGYTNPADASYWSESEFAMQYGGVFKNAISSIGHSYLNGGRVSIGTNVDNGVDQVQVTGNSNFTGNVTATALIKSGGTSTQILMADGSTTTKPLVYIALISQSGTSNPTAIVLENTLGSTPTYTRTGVGSYQVNTTSDINKTVIDIQDNYFNGDILLGTFSGTICPFATGAYAGGTLSDGHLSNTYITIIVYP